MAEVEDQGTRIQNLYWKQFIQLKVECEYMRRYQAAYRWWVTRIEVGRAVSSVSALGAWAAVHVYPLLWGGIIAAAQVADAAQGAIPFNRQYHSASALVLTLDAMFITAVGEWEEIAAGRMDYVTVGKARRRMMKQMHDAQAKHFPTGLHRREDLFKLAETDAAAYFTRTFGTEPT